MVTEQGSDGIVDRLKGPALAVFLVLGREGWATRRALSAATGWARNATYSALQRLVAAGWAAPEAGGLWRVTAAGTAAWTLMVGRREAAGEEVPGDSPVTDSGTRAGKGDKGPRARRARSAGGVPVNGTNVPRTGKVVPGNGKPVPRKGTDAPQNGVPRKGTVVPENGKPVPRRGTAVPDNGTHARDHDDLDPDHVDDDHQSSADQALIRRLRALDDPFGGAEGWLPEQDRKRVAGWLQHVEEMPPAQRAQLRSDSAFLRDRVESGMEPPPPRRKGRKGKACPTCGRSMWDSDGSCLVCSGVVRC